MDDRFLNSHGAKVGQAKVSVIVGLFDSEVIIRKTLEEVRDLRGSTCR